MNCVKWWWAVLVRSALLGMYLDTVLKSSGKTLSLVSAVALHLVSRCTMSSAGAG